MKIDFFGKVYISLMACYFITSAFNALLYLDEKLARIGLSAIDDNGKIAFILIYCSLMTSIGLSIALLFYFSKKWQYSALIATTTITSFICFRLVGSAMLGTLTSTQASFIVIELIEVSIGIFLLIKSKDILETNALTSN